MAPRKAAPKVWLICNNKGGVGKTLTAINLAIYSEYKAGIMTALIDSDPQACIATLWHDVRRKDKDKKRAKRPMVVEATFEGLSGIIQSAADFQVELVIIDTRGHADSDIVAAVKLSDLIICPATNSLLAWPGLRETAKVLEACEAMHKAVAFVNCIPAKDAEQTHAEASGFAAKFGFKVAPTYISDRPSFERAIDQGLGVIEVKPQDKAAAGQIKALWEYLTELCPIPSRDETEAETA
jgi:cellulose biosynthesis protein BcsQ